MDRRPTIVRLAVAEPRRAEWLARVLVGSPLLGEGGLGRVEPASGDCRTIRLAAGAVDADGRPVRAAELADGLEDRTEAVRRWLLAPVRPLRSGADGTLDLCLHRDVPDLSIRLAHPAVRIAWKSAWDGLLAGPGLYRMDSESAFRKRAAEGILFDEVRLVAGDPPLLLRVGEADVGVVHGTAVRELAELAHLQGKRFPRRDRIYFLWFERRARWVNDPRLRHWLAAVTRPARLAGDLFGDAAEPAAGLLPGVAVVPRQPDPGQRPLGAGTVPRLTFGYSGSDANAEVLARRIAAEWGSAGLDVTLLPLDSSEEPVRKPDVRLGVYEPLLGDPVIDLACTLVSQSLVAPAALHLLDQASRWPPGSQRENAARLAIAALTDSAELVPVVKLGGWRFTRVGFTPPPESHLARDLGGVEWWLWSP